MQKNYNNNNLDDLSGSDVSFEDEVQNQPTMSITNVMIDGDDEIQELSANNNNNITNYAEQLLQFGMFNNKRKANTILEHPAKRKRNNDNNSSFRDSNEIILKQEPIEFSIKHPLSDSDLLAAVKYIRGEHDRKLANNALDNCSTVTNLLLKFLKTGELQVASPENNTFDSAPNWVTEEKDSVFIKMEASDIIEIPITQYSTYAIERNTTLHDHIPFPAQANFTIDQNEKVELDQNGIVVLNNDSKCMVTDIENNKTNRDSIDIGALPSRLLNLALEAGGVSFGEICITHVNKHVKENAHHFVFYAVNFNNNSYVKFIDATLYDAIKKKGTPIFSSLTDKYNFINNENAHDKETFSRKAFYLSHSLLNLYPVPSYERPIPK